MNAVAETLAPAVSTEIPAPIVFTDSAAASVVQNLIQEVFDKSFRSGLCPAASCAVTDYFEGFRDDESVDVGAGPHFESLIRRIVESCAAHCDCT